MPERSIENFSSDTRSPAPDAKRAAAVLAVGSLGAGAKVDGSDLDASKCLQALRWMRGILANSPLISGTQMEALDLATKRYADRVASGAGGEGTDNSNADSDAPRAERLRTSLSCIRQIAPELPPNA